MSKKITEMNVTELREHLQAEAPHLLTALTELDKEDGPLVAALVKKGKTRAQAEAIVSGSKEEKSEEGALTEADVRRIFEDAQEGQPTAEEFETKLTERAEELIGEREEQRALAAIASSLIEAAEGIPAAWKTDLKARYAMQPSGPSDALLVEAETDDDGKEKSVEQVLRENVAADLDHARGLIAEARGKPRVKGEGGKKPDAGDGESSRTRAQERERVPYWRERFVSMGLAESVDQAVEIYGGKAPKEDED